MGAYEAAEHLRYLLSRPGMARQIWQRRLRTTTPAGRINQAAVGQILAEYLWSTGLRADSDTALPRRLKDTVARALSGERLTPEKIGWFCVAFALPSHEEQRLLSLVEGSSFVRPLTSADGPAQALEPRPPYRTLSLNEHHYLGPDGQPVRHSTTQVIQAGAEGLAVHRYVFDTDALTVDVLQGGRLGSQVVPAGGGLFAIDIVLTTALHAGQTATLRYDTRFAGGAQLPSEFRRAAYRPVHNVDLRVQFDPQRVPRRVFRTEWPGLTDPPSHRVAIALDADLAAHQFLPTIQGRVVGFTWQW